MPDFYPDIFDYLNTNDVGYPITSLGLEEYIFKIMAYTGFTYEVSSSFVKYYFQEIMVSMLKGERLDLKKFGSFYLSGKYAVPTFTPKKSFAKLLNARNRENN